MDNYDKFIRFMESDDADEKLAVALINAFESERDESGRSEVANGLSYLLRKYGSKPYDMRIVDDVITFMCGFGLDTLMVIAKTVDLDDY